MGKHSSFSYVDFTECPRDPGAQRVEGRGSIRIRVKIYAWEDSRLEFSSHATCSTVFLQHARINQKNDFSFCSFIAF